LIAYERRRAVFLKGVTFVGCGISGEGVKPFSLAAN
jgi:hypothetical protein